ncbi:hypothetical protein BKA82DRAFT_2984270 [Pisolithus tinctorius]|nr:hypothetical protein BKA82DRAFT_2984270 [Pisolithus tinctorius]
MTIRKIYRASHRLASAQNQNQSQSQSSFQPLAKSTPKDHGVTDVSVSLSALANLSIGTNVTKGSVRDRMMDWERERARLREMNRASTVLSGSYSGSATTSGSSDVNDAEDLDSEVEAEVEAEAQGHTAVNQRKPEPEVQIPDEAVNIRVSHNNPELVGRKSVQTMHTTTTVVSSASGLATSTLTGGSGPPNAEKGQIEVATIAKTLGPDHHQRARKSEEVLKSVDDNGLPVEVRRTSESALSGFKHSIKASIDKGVRLYKSSTLAQLTGRTTPDDLAGRIFGPRRRSPWTE